MGIFKTIGKGFKAIGKGLKKAAPVLGAVAGNIIAPGIGGVIGGGLGGAISRTGKGKSVGDVLGGAALGAGGAALANAASPGKGFSLDSLLSEVKKVGIDAVTNPSTGKLDPTKLLALVGTGAGAISAGKQSGEAMGFLKDAQGRAAEDREARKPLRDLAIKRLLAGQATKRPDLSARLADPTNPFSSAAQSEPGLVTPGTGRRIDIKRLMLPRAA